MCRRRAGQIGDRYRSPSANRLDVAVGVDSLSGGDQQPLGHDCSMILTPHDAESADHEDGGESRQRADGSVAVRRVVGDDAEIE